MSLRILIVDDNVEAASAICKLLSIRGNECRLAGSASAALESADAMHPDLILLDLAMPDADGFTLHRQLQEKTDLQPTKMVAYSAFDDELHRRKAEAEGFDGYLVKARPLAELFELITQIELNQSNNSGSI